MALGPKQMGEAIARNMKAKTGKSLEEWTSIARASGILNKKEMIHYLKKEKGLGHFQAARIYEEVKGENPYANEEQFENKIFESPKTLKIYTLLKHHILKIGDDVRIQPCKTYIPFYRKNQFAAISATNDIVKVSIHLPNNVDASPFQIGGNTGSSRLNHHMVFQDLKDLSNQVLDVLQLAYKYN